MIDDDTKRVLTYFENRIKEWPPFYRTDTGWQRLHIDVNGLPEEVANNPGAKEGIDRIALMIASSQDIPRPGKPDRLRKKITDVMEFMYQPYVRNMLAANLGAEDAKALLEDLGKGLNWEMVGQWKGAVLEVSPDHSEVNISPPTLTPKNVAIAVANVLIENRFIINAGRSGLLVNTLVALGNATGIKMNAQHSASFAISTIYG